MATWDKTKPAGTQKLRLSDDEIRDQWDCLEDAIGREHTFPGTYGSDAGQHAAGAEGTAGMLQIATEAEALALTIDDKAVTPLKLGAVLTQEVGRDAFGFERLKLINNSGTPTSKIDIDAEAIVVKDSSGNPLTLRDVDLTVDCTTTGANGLDTGSLANDTWYYFYVIAKPDKTTAGLASASATSPTMPSGYTYNKLVSAIRYGTATFRQIIQRGKVLACSDFGLDLSGQITENYSTWGARDISAYVPSLTIAIQVQAVNTVSGSSNNAIAIAIARNSSGAGGVCVSTLNNREVITGIYSALPPFWFTLAPATPQLIYCSSTNDDNYDRGHFYLHGYELDI